MYIEVSNNLITNEGFTMKNVSIAGLPIIRVTEQRALELSNKKGFRYHSKTEKKAQDSQRGTVK